MQRGRPGPRFRPDRARSPSASAGWSGDSRLAATYARPARLRRDGTVRLSCCLLRQENCVGREDVWLY